MKILQSIKIQFLFILILLQSCSMAQNNLNTVESVDLQRYVGKWYEIASYPMSFQKDCYCVTADYTITEKGYVKVYNSCRKGSVDGKNKSITGKAFVVEGTGNAKLKVQFFWPFKSDYWIIDLDPEYKWAVVSGPSQKYLWILSREPNLDEAIFQGIAQRLIKNGFDLSKLKRMVHK